MFSPTVAKLIKIFSKFPAVGPRTATRFVFYLMRLPKNDLNELLNSISEFRKTIKICRLCFNPFEGEAEICPICQNPNRDKSLLCLVENETDLSAIEKTKKYNGLYFILGQGIKNLRTKELLELIKNPQIKEIILALNPTINGEAFILHLERLLKPLGKKITRLARGLPVGSELEYADDETLSSALENRK